MTIGLYAFYLNDTQPYSGTQTRSAMPYRTQERIIEKAEEYEDVEITSRGQDNAQTTMTIGLYAFYLNDTQTRSARPFIYSHTQTRPTIPFIYSDTQTRSTIPFPFSENTFTKSNVNKKIYSATEINIIQNMPIQKGNDHFMNVYNNMHNHHVTSPDGIDVKRLRRPLKYNLKPREFDDRFKEPLQKLASMKASYYNGEDNPFKKEIELVNNPENIFNGLYTTSTEKVNVNERFKNADLLRSNTDYPPKVERLINTDVTQTEWYPWIQTGAPIHRASFNLPGKQTTATPVYPWLTKRLPVPTTKILYQKPRFIYEHKEDLRIRPPKVENMPIQKRNDNLMNVYDYMQNHHVTSPDGIDVKRLKRPLNYNLKPREIDDTHHSIIDQHQKYVDYGTSETPIEKFRSNQKIKSEFLKDETRRISIPTNIPDIERFKEPLQKLASMKASYYNGESNPFRKEIELVNNPENIFNVLYTTSTEKRNINERVKNAALLRSNTDYPPKVERLINTDVTQTEWYPWIQTGAPKHRASFNLPGKQTTATPVYPRLTKRLPVPTTKILYQKPRFIYEHKEDLRIRPETLNSVKQEPRQEIQTVTHRFEPDRGYGQVTQVTGMHEQMESEPFSIFLTKLMKILASKSLSDLKGLISIFERSITTLLDSGKLMKLGMTTGSFIAELTTSLNAPMKDIQRQLFIMQVSLENRRRMLDDGFNTILDELDNVYDVSEEEAMQRILREAMRYPNTSKSGEQIVQEFIEDIFLHPMNRIAGTAYGNEVFANIAEIANKYNTPENLEPMARLHDNQYQITKYNKLRNGTINDEHKFIYSHSTKYQARRHNKNIEKEDINIESHSNDEEDEDESSSGDNAGVEIKIRINNRKHSKRNNRRILKKHTRNNVYTRTDEYDHELFTTENINTENYGLTNIDLRKYAKYPTNKHISGRKSNWEETGPKTIRNDDGEILKSEVSKVTNKSKVTLQFDCEALPVIVKKKNNSNRQNYTNLTESEMIMYCSNANDNN
ncbi:uncharacterized protein LOC134802320 [Cydia splendana]|uniref:uncharacterized protein LOC134802320 n=1 Tax=Cydia splendana TaxID=1100963 RepID=UPI00300CE85F